MLLKFPRWKEVKVISRELGLWAARRLRPDLVRGYWVYAEGDADCEQIREALAFLPKNPGGLVTLSEEGFDIQTTMDMASFQNLKGQGQYATSLDANVALSGAVIQAVGASAASMQTRFGISSLAINGGSYDVQGLYFKWSKQIILRDLYIYSCDEEGLYMLTCWDSNLMNVEFWDNGDLTATKYQVFLEREATDYLNNIAFFGCRFEGNPYNNVVVGTNCRKVRFHGCKFHGIIGAAVAYPHLHFKGEDGGLYGCNLTLSGSMGVYLSDGGDRFSIMGSNIDNCTTYGLQVGDYQVVSIDGGHFHSNTSGDIYLGASANLTKVRISPTTILESTTPIVVHGNVDKDEVLDESAGARVALSFMQTDVAASQSAVALEVSGAAGNTEQVMTNPGSIIGISIASNAARTAGTCTVDVTKNGTVSGLQGVLDGTNTQYHQATQFQGADDFATGDRIGVKITTDAGWLPVTADIAVTVIVGLR